MAGQHSAETDEADDLGGLDGDRLMPMTIKAVPVKTRLRAVNAAKKQGQSMGEWIVRAINQLADREAGQREILPSERSNQTREPPGQAVVAVVLTPAELEATMRAALAVGEASGLGVPKVIARHAFALLNAQMRAARGMPAAPPRRRPAKPVATIEHDRPVPLRGRGHA